MSSSLLAMWTVFTFNFFILIKLSFKFFKAIDAIFSLSSALISNFNKLVLIPLFAIMAIFLF